MLEPSPETHDASLVLEQWAPSDAVPSRLHVLVGSQAGQVSAQRHRDVHVQISVHIVPTSGVAPTPTPHHCNNCSIRTNTKYRKGRARARQMCVENRLGCALVRRPPLSPESLDVRCLGNTRAKAQRAHNAQHIRFTEEHQGIMLIMVPKQTCNTTSCIGGAKCQCA